MITLYSFKHSPNGWVSFLITVVPFKAATDTRPQKVVVVLEALGLQYETKWLDINKGEQKEPEYTKLCPNGREYSHTARNCLIADEIITRPSYYHRP